MGQKTLQKVLSQGIVAVEHMHLVEGVWKILVSLLAKRFAPLCLLRSELCHLSSVPVELPLRFVARKGVLECFSSRDMA